LKFQVLILQDAEDDIFDIYRYVLDNDSKARARYVVDSLKETIFSLELLPTRGHVPPELKRIEATGYLEVHFKPYRIIYEIDGKKVFVHAVLDGRRELQSLLERRLFR
jgi:toxin ParE1/3/4